MEKLDELVLNRLADRVFTAERVAAMVQELKALTRQARTAEDGQLRALQNELKAKEQSLERLYQAVEQGVLPLDDTLSQRAHKLKSLSEILCVRHNLSPRSMYAKQDEQEETGSGAAPHSQRIH